MKRLLVSAAIVVGLIIPMSVRSETADGTTIKCVKNPLVVCVEIPGSGGMGIIIFNGPAELNGFTYERPAPLCSIGETSGTAVFAHTSATDPNQGVGYIGVGVCVSSNHQTTTVYTENSAPYTSYSSWQAALP